MKFDVITTFPEIIEPVAKFSIIKKALANRLLELNIIQLRKFTSDKHKVTDDYPYGGGSGMVMKAEPFIKALKDIETKNSFKIYMSPKGKKFNQTIVKDLSQKEHLIILCGHYEDIDNRIIEKCDMEISIGDYVLTGGELPAAVLIDSVARCIPGVIKEDSLVKDSFYNGLLDHNYYTRPNIVNGSSVPEVLTSGDHSKIENYRHQESLRITEKRRVELFSDVILKKKEIDWILGV